MMLYNAVAVPPETVVITDTSTGELLQGDVYILPNTSHNFTCSVSGTKPPAQITWAFQDEDAVRGVHEVPIAGGGGLFSVRSTFTVPPLQRTPEDLTCLATGAGNITISAMIRLRLMKSGKV